MFLHRFRQGLWLLFSLLKSVVYGRIGFLSYVACPLLVIRHKYIFIGNRVRIMPGIRLESFEEARILIGNNVSIGPNCTLVSGDNKDVEIGDNVTISANVFICSYEHDYRDIGVHIMEQSCIGSSTVIGAGSFIGYGSVLLAGTVLGKQCVVGANSVVRGTFPDYCVIAGSPARVIKQYSFESGKWERIYYE